MPPQGEQAAVARMNAELAGILRILRRESRVPELLATGLEAIMQALGAEGIAVIRGAPDSAATEPEVLHRAGMIGLPATSAAMLLWRAEIGTPALSVEPNGRPIVVTVCRDSSTEKLGMVLWRRRGARAWAGDDVGLMDAAAGIVWLLIDREAGQRNVFRA